MTKRPAEGFFVNLIVDELTLVQPVDPDIPKLPEQVTVVDVVT